MNKKIKKGNLTTRPDFPSFSNSYQYKFSLSLYTSMNHWLFSHESA